MKALMDALRQGGSTLTEAQARAIVVDSGLDPENLTEVQIQSVCSAVGAKAKTSAALAKPAKAAGIARKGRKAQAPAQESVRVENPAEQVAQVFNGLGQGQSAIVEGFVSQTIAQAEQDAETMLQAAYGMTPLTLQLLADGLGAGLQEGHFDPERFRQLGASLVTSAGAFSRDSEAS